MWSGVLAGCIHAPTPTRSPGASEPLRGPLPRVWQELPVHAIERATYRVASGDTFYSIARGHGIDVGELMALNPECSPRSLEIGTLLRLPSGKPAVRAVEQRPDR